MLLEIGIFLPIFALWYFNIVGIKIFLLFFYIYYWLPKWLVVRLMNKYFPQVLTHKNIKEKKVCLTFDDVPYGDDTFLEIVSLLNDYAMKASFFVISDYVKQVGPLVGMVKIGHQLVNHGKTNSPHVLKGLQSLEDEIVSCENLLNEIYSLAHVNRGKSFYRPGCGLFNSTMLNYCKEHDVALTLGSVYPNDPLVRSAYLNFLYVKAHIEAGDIVILHDRKWTLPMIRYLLPWMKQNGYTSVTLNDMFCQ